jgi:site-specific recombinase XerD
VVPYLEQYLSVWRPLLTKDPTNDVLFLTHAGNPYDRGEFGRWIKEATLKWLGK